MPRANASVQPCAAVTTRIVNPLIAAVNETFEMMLDCTAERKQLELRSASTQLLDLSAVIGISGQAKGAVCLSFALETALAIVERFVGVEASRATPEVLDALGEVVNIVAGSTKSKINMGLNMGLPNVVHGIDHKIDFPTNSHPIRLHFDSGLGPFVVDFGFVVRDF